jgi:hypothetical protein
MESRSGCSGKWKIAGAARRPTSMFALARPGFGSYGAGHTGQIQEALMARRPSKQSAAKRKVTPRKKPAARPLTIGEEFMSAYRVVRDTFKGTGRMRNKMERPGTDETE